MTPAVDPVEDLETVVTLEAEIPYALIRHAMHGEPYPMELVAEDADACIKAVNQGIDARLQACNTKGRDSYEVVTRPGPLKQRVLACRVSPDSLPVLLRRLYEQADEASEQLADDILLTLGFDNRGQLVGREALGLD